MKDKFNPTKPKFIGQSSPKVGDNTNRLGFENTRNKAKPYRRVRYIDDGNGGQKPHPLDMMKMLVNEKEILVNMTGCFGSRNTFKEFGSHVVRRGAPGRHRQPRTKKHGGKLFYGDPDVIYWNGVIARVKDFRKEMLKVVISAKKFDISIPVYWPVMLDLADAYLKARLSITEYEKVFNDSIMFAKSVAGSEHPYKWSDTKINTEVVRILYLVTGKTIVLDDCDRRKRVMERWNARSKQLSRKKKSISTSSTIKYRA